MVMQNITVSGLEYTENSNEFLVDTSKEEVGKLAYACWKGAEPRKLS